MSLRYILLTLGICASCSILSAQCPAAWTDPEPESPITITPMGIERGEGTGSGLVYLQETLPKEEDGWLQFKVASFGENPSGEDGIIQVGVNKGGKIYKYHLSTERTVFVDNNGNLSVLSLDKEIGAGSEIRLSKVGNDLRLYIDNNLLYYMKGILDGDSDVFIDIREENTIIELPIQSFSCEKLIPTNPDPCAGAWGSSSSGNVTPWGVDGLQNLVGVGSGGNRVEMDEVLATDDLGHISLRADNFGTNSKGGRASIILGAKIGGSDYDFVVNPAGTVVSQLNGKAQAVFMIGDVLSDPAHQAQLKLERINGALNLEIDDVAIGGLTVPMGSTVFYLDLSGQGAQIQNTIQNFDCDNVYGELKNELKGGVHLLGHDNLRIKYIQEYAVPNPSIITYNIYAWDRTVALSGFFLQEYGVNWKEIDVSTLSSQTFYVFEMTTNKNKKYALRFKTK